MAFIGFRVKPWNFLGNPRLDFDFAKKKLFKGLVKWVFRLWVSKHDRYVDIRIVSMILNVKRQNNIVTFKICMLWICFKLRLVLTSPKWPNKTLDFFYRCLYIDVSISHEQLKFHHNAWINRREYLIWIVE